MPARIIEAEYADGVLRPLDPLDLDEGQRVTPTLTDIPRRPWNANRAKAAIYELAALPLEGEHQPGETVSTSHDKHLYPQKD
jgi:predicted DNA-binding antitoxin AbrB/MazE fold protein